MTHAHPRRSILARWSVAAMTAAAFAATSLATPDASAQSLGRLEALGSLDFRQVIRDAKSEVFPAVVFIKVVRQGMEAGETENQEVSGSGVIIDEKGHVLTNWHVVEQAVEVRCLLSDGRAFDAEVVGSDKPTDMAIIRLVTDEPETLPRARVGDSSSLVEGDFVMAMGAPWGMNRSVSIGIVSCIDRYLEEASEYSHWLQTDAAISPGNSGGPLVNTEGEIIGINTRGGGDMGFAVPSAVFVELVPHLIESGAVPWSWTGLQIQPLRDFNRDLYFDFEEGVMVAGTDPRSPALAAGLEINDRIIAINGEPITAGTTEDLPAVRRALGLLPMGEPAVFTIVRDGETMDVELTPREKGSVEGEDYDCTRWDMAVKEINQFEHPDLYFHREKGVFVFSTKWPGNASNSGLMAQDIILSINGEPVETLADVERVHTAAVENVDSEHRAVFRLLRGGLFRQVVLDFLRDYSVE